MPQQKPPNETTPSPTSKVVIAFDVVMNLETKFQMECHNSMFYFSD